jgi:hypothetical protein
MCCRIEFLRPQKPSVARFTLNRCNLQLDAPGRFDLRWQASAIG